ncbi:MAG: hypothetical protein Ta2A_23490 [Treponemataceae bacterium]|nr:MAG: hypothetical protein Ta2A_23490 [Treponemataceae bacterium]
MATITSTVKVGQKPPKEILQQAKREFKEASKHPPLYDADSPESTPEALKEFAMQAAAIRRNRKIRPTVSLRILPSCLEKYKAFGKGYTGIMADVLNYAAENPEFLAKAVKA